LRTVAIARAQSLFALPEHIEPYLTRVLLDLAEADLLRGRPLQQFVERLTHYYAELNVVHPFRDGNGRTLRRAPQSQRGPSCRSASAGPAARQAA
jgi:cell filamentation protein